MNSGNGGEVAAASMGPPQPLEWKFSQVFGERTSAKKYKKGSFNIHNGFKHGTLSDPIQAHPPGKVHRKVYEFSMLLPEVLHFELFPCRELWMNLFQAYCPDGKNIGLYFFPSNSERSKDYFSLLESMIQKDLALRKQIADVELLLFASTRLSPDCQHFFQFFYLSARTESSWLQVTVCFRKDGVAIVYDCVRPIEMQAMMEGEIKQLVFSGF